MLRELIKKLMALGGEEQESALAELTAFSGILKLDELLERQLKELTMLDTDINLEENAVIRPLIEKGRLKGEQQGMQKGMQKGRQDLLLNQLAERFGPVPEWASDKVRHAALEQLDRWGRLVLRSSTLEDTLT